MSQNVGSLPLPWNTMSHFIEPLNVWLNLWTPPIRQNSLLLDVSQPSVCGIFRSGLSGSQINSQERGTTDRLFISLPERQLLKILHTYDGETSRRSEFSQRARHQAWTTKFNTTSAVKDQVDFIFLFLFSFFSCVHGAMGCGQKSLMIVRRCHQLLLGFCPSSLLIPVPERN